MKRTTFVTGFLLVSLLLSACSVIGRNDPAQAAQNSGNTGASGSNTRELPQAMKLALGTFKLEKTSTPVDAAEAAQLLFLWKGMRNLSQEQTVATEEAQGLVKQIQETMKPEQIDAINGMNLSFQDIATIAKETGLDLGSFGGQSGNLSPECAGDLPGCPPEWRWWRRLWRRNTRRRGGGGNRQGGGIPGAGGPPVSSTNTSGASQTRGAGGSFSKLGISPTMIDAVIQYLQTKAEINIHQFSFKRAARMAEKRILVVDDDHEVVRLMRGYLEQSGYEVLVAYNGQTAMHMIRRERPDLVLLDLMLPDLDGWDITRSVRADPVLKHTPIIVLTARVTDADKIVGLELGADDYVTKPYNPREVVSRVRARLRIQDGVYEAAQQKILRLGGLQIDLGRRETVVDGRDVSLTATEFEILRVLMEQAGYVLTRSELIREALGSNFLGIDRTLDSHIRNLRQKIETDPKNPLYIKTVYGVGYRLEPGVEQ